MTKKLKIGVIFGGKSGEHEVSLVSAQSILNAMDPDKYDVVPIGITKEGRWVVGADITRGESVPLANSPTRSFELGAHETRSSKQIEPSNVLSALKTGDFSPLKPATLPADPTQQGLLSMDQDHHGLHDQAQQMNLMLHHLDVVFPVLHGPLGEDGTIQGLFELANIPFVGSGVLASAVGMDKSASKAIWGAAGLPQVPYLSVKRSAWEAEPHEWATKIQSEFRLPVFVKPSTLGSSVGISKIKTWEDLPKAMELACRFGRKILIEQGVDAREIELAVLGNEDPIVSIPGEVLVAGEFYDFYDKYVNGASTTQIPADLTPEQVETFQRIARQAFETIDACGFARVDFFLERSGPNMGNIYLNEINTIPGFTSISMYPKLMEASGVGYRELIDRLIELALERHRDNARTQTQFSSESDWFLS